MAKVYIDYDEFYPIFFTVAKFGKEVELTEEEIAFIHQVVEDFWKAQAILEKAYGDR